MLNLHTFALWIVLLTDFNNSWSSSSSGCSSGMVSSRSLDTARGAFSEGNLEPVFHVQDIAREEFTSGTVTVCTFPCVRYRARVISRTRFSRSMSEFLVRYYTRARDVLTTRMLVTLALPVKTKDGQQGAGNFTCGSSPKTKG